MAVDERSILPPPDTDAYALDPGQAVDHVRAAVESDVILVRRDCRYHVGEGTQGTALDLNKPATYPGFQKRPRDRLVDGEPRLEHKLQGYGFPFAALDALWGGEARMDKPAPGRFGLWHDT